MPHLSAKSRVYVSEVNYLECGNVVASCARSDDFVKSADVCEQPGRNSDLSLGARQPHADCGAWNIERQQNLDVIQNIMSFSMRERRGTLW